MRTTLKVAILVILGIPNAEMYAKYVAAKTAIRLLGTEQWKIRLAGFSSILSVFNIKIDLCISSMDFVKNYDVQFPTRVLEGKALMQVQMENVYRWFKDRNRLWSRFFFQDSFIRQSFRLPDYCSVFQGEIFAIYMAGQQLRTLNYLNIIEAGGKIAICVDSHAALKALEALHSSSSLEK